jgi:hypothetical protein
MSTPAIRAFGHATVGTIAAVEDGTAIVTYGGDRTRRGARSCVNISADDVGREVVLLFDGDDAARPIIMGMLQPARGPRTIVLSATDSIIIRCGEASLTLSEGRVVARGLHVVTHASGVNRIRGGSVEIN